LRVLLIHIGVSPSGEPRRREQRLTVEELKIGRAPSNDLSLPGLSISFHHATIHRGQAAALIECIEPAELRRNGHVERSARLQIGDVIRIGRWELRVALPGPAEDLVLEIEERELRGNELEGLRERTRLGVARGVLTARSLAWTSLIAILGLFLVAPLGFDWLTESWSSGAIARKHAFIADECEKCHATAFARVSNDSCNTCHPDVGNHAHAEARTDEMTNFRCATCHKDHNGDSKLISMDQPLCERCHNRIHDVYAASDLNNVSDFGTDHPRFRFEVVTNPNTADPERLAAGPELRERSGLRFDHFRHVGRLSTLPQGGLGILNCGDCHQPDAVGLGMQPIAFELHCRSCHPLSFDPTLPGTEALHTDPAKMRAELRALYSERVLSGRVGDSGAPKTVRFMRPGKTLNKSESKVVSVWVGTMVDRAEDHLMREPGECARCHELVDGGASDGGTAIESVNVTSSWLPRAKFSHRTHAPFQCRACHPAAAVYDPADDPDTARPKSSMPDSHPYGLLTPAELRDAHQVSPSESAEDVLIPDRDQCRTCHLGTDAEPPVIPSECVLCHPFHRPGHGPIDDSTAQPHALPRDSSAGSLPADADLGDPSFLLTHRRVTRSRTR
jgi:hypothetical protein